MKRFCSIILFIFLSITSFLLVSKNVYAADQNFTLTDDDFTILSDLSTFTTIVDTYISNSADLSSDYFIWRTYYNNSYTYKVYIKKISENLARPNFGLFYNTSYGGNFISGLNQSGTTCTFNLSNNTLTSCSTQSARINSFITSGNYYNFIYSTFDIFIAANNSYNYIFSYSGSTFTDSYSTTGTISSLYTLDTILRTPPTPTDDFPLLTSFYNLCLEKFALISEEFSSNYIYIAIITIFLLITIVYFLKRRLT